MRTKKTENINVKNNVYKNGYRRRNFTSKTAKIHRFVRFVIYCIITTCSVESYWHCSEETVHYKSDETVNCCGFTCANTSPITVFINVVFLHLSPITLQHDCDSCDVAAPRWPSALTSQKLQQAYLLARDVILREDSDAVFISLDYVNFFLSILPVSDIISELANQR